MKKIRVFILFIAVVLITFLLLINTNNDISPSDSNDYKIFYRNPATSSAFMSQEGTEADPYVINGTADMVDFSNRVSEGNNYENKIIIVAANINEIILNDFQPIGTTTKPFKGTFDGYGVNFKVQIKNEALSNQGFFGVIEGGVVENFSVSGSITGLNYVGGIVGEQRVGSTIRNVYNTATVTGNSMVGGIVGLLNQGTIVNTQNAGEIIGTTNVGGLVGYTYQYRNTQNGLTRIISITNSYSSGLVTGNTVVGGVIGGLSAAYYSSRVETTRANIYYDTTVIANYEQEKILKPSSLASVEGLNSGIMFDSMDSKLLTGWTYKASSNNYSYYPQISYFAQHANNQIKSRSLEENTIDTINGIGTEEKPFLIRTISDIEDLKRKINKGSTFESYFYKVAEGKSSFNLGDFDPIGINGKPFYGSFDGNNTQFTLNIDTTTPYQGLFGRYGKGTIKNLSVTGSIKGTTYIGGIVGYLESGIISNVYNLANLEGTTYLGGIVGWQNSGTIAVSYNNGNITATDNQVGGIVGRLDNGIVKDTYNHGEIVGKQHVGGIVGYTHQYNNTANGVYRAITVTNSYSSGLVSANLDVGGVIGGMNTYYYSSSTQSTRTNLYYDISVISKYDQPNLLKPVTTASAQGLTTDKLLYATATSLKFDSSTWNFKTKIGANAYYPQLEAFATSKVSLIVSESLSSTLYDVGDGLGTKEFPFLIRNKFDMDELSRKVLAGNTYVQYHFKVDNGITEIDLGNFVPIGSLGKIFQGSFDGNGVNFILDINNASLNYQGLFGIAQTGVIENLSVSGNIEGQNNVGGIVGEQRVGSIIRNVYNMATVTGGSNVGGIVGHVDQGTIVNTYNQGEIIGNNNVGGIVGYTYYYRNTANGLTRIISITNSYSAGEITSNSVVGGVIGALSLTYYSSSTQTTRNNLYYDITVIANYDQKNKNKPSSLVSAEGLSSGVMFTEMGSKLLTGWIFREAADGWAYYPQLSAFVNSNEPAIKKYSTDSVKIDVKDGVGTAEFPFIIYDKQGLEDLKMKINGGNTFQGFHFLIADSYSETDLGNFTPIGINGKPFYGSFDGNNTQFILDINASTEYTGLFGRFGIGTIKNLSVTGTIKGTNYIGGIVGYLESGTLTNVYNLANITGTNYIGGIVGWQNKGLIEVAYNTGNITATGSQIGGVVGRLDDGTTTNTYNRGEIIGHQYVGGVVGYTHQYNNTANGVYRIISITNSYSSGLVSANLNVGGVIGGLNTYYYSSSTQSNRSNLYYDTSVILMYDQPNLLKPAATKSAQGLTTDRLVYASDSTLGFSSAIWYFKAKDGSNSYYPQLLTLANSATTKIANDSIVSTKYFIGDGLGTKEFPFLIRNKFDMDELSRKVLAGNTYIEYHFKVEDGISEIDLEDFVAIGSLGKIFHGSFDGNGVNFKLDINKSTLNYQGLFGIAQTGIIENLSVSGNVEGLNNVGGIVGEQRAGSIIRNVYNMATVTGNSNVGGIVGHVDQGTIVNTYNRGEIIGNTNVGGIVGYTYYYRNTANGLTRIISITNSYSSGEVTANSAVGGVIGTLSLTYYSSAVQTTRNNLYYDITVIANYAQKKKIKPSSLASAEGLSSGVFFDKMDTKLLTGWTFTETMDGFAYYPQLSVFVNSQITVIKANSVVSVIVDVSDGLGTEEYPFIIYDKQGLEDLKLKINGGNTFQGFFFVIDEDYSETDLGAFSPIGINGNPFYGSFDGNHTQFTINTTSAGDYAGLFGRFGLGTIKNLSITGEIKGDSYLGGIVGYQESGIISNVYNLANLAGINYLGGIVGWQSNGTIDSSYNMGKISATGNQIGGITGRLDNGKISNTYNRGEIIGHQYVGGVIGYTHQYNNTANGVYRAIAVTNSYSAGLVSANLNVGGVIGGLNTYYYSSSTQSTRSNIYYDASLLTSYVQPNKLKPSSTIGGQALDKVSMFEHGMETKGLSSQVWEFKAIEGNYAFYPQLKVFANNLNAEAVNDSILSVQTNPFMGDGSKLSPYLIRNEKDMEILASSINKEYDALGIYYLVAMNVVSFNLDFIEFTGIGNETTPFKGFFDGNYANFNLGIDTTNNYQGLFGNISSEAIIENLSVTGNVKANNYVGAVVGYNNGLVRNVHTRTNVNGNNYVGGIIGYNNGTLEAAFNTGNVIATGNYAGGLTAFNNGNISNAYNGGKVQGKSNVGGLIGYSNNELLEKLYYNKTLIYFDDIVDGLIKPTNAISNISTFDAFGIEKEQMTGLDIFGNGEGQMDFSSDLWTLKATSGLYDYYPQLKGFAENTNATVVNNSVASSRIIRFTYGSGSKTNPFLIRDEDDMKALSDITKADDLLGLYFKVMDGVKTLDLTIEGLGYEKIGHTNARPFRGGFDGNGVSIIINTNTTTTDYVGLFGYLGIGSEIKNLTIEGFINGRNRVGGLAGESSGAIISNIGNHATITGTQYVAGLIGVITDTEVSLSYNMANITSNSRDIGGVIGWGQRSVIANSFNYGNITASLVVGGVIGYAANNMTIKNVYNRGSIKGTGANSYAGGIIGASYTNTTLENSYSAGAVIGKGATYLGGLIGRVSGVTHEVNSYYDQSIVEAELLGVGFLYPTAAVGNKLNQIDVKEITKTLLVGNNGKTNTNLSSDDWVFIPTSGVDAYYPQLRLFVEHYNDYVIADSLRSVKSYIFVGEGLATNPHIIVTNYDMENLANLVNSGITFIDVYFKVKDDISEIDLTYGISFIAIGNATTPFEGSFDGTGTNFNINLNSTNDNTGLFGYLGENGEVRNLSVSGTVKGLNNTAGIVGNNSGLVENVYATVDVIGQNNVGIISGVNNGVINDVYTIGSVVGNDFVGGLVGYNQGSMTNGYASAGIFGISGLGGVVGYSTGIEANLYYNTSKLEVSTNTNDSLSKPFIAVSNKASTEDVQGVTTNDLYGGYIVFTSNNWKFEQSTGFYAYYPQLTIFANSKYKVVQVSSRDSVTVNKFNEGNGSEEFPYIIRNENDMEAVSQMMQAKYTLENIYFEVAKEVELIDLTLLKTLYSPIGNATYQFQGNFKGNGVVFNIDIDRKATHQGIFGVIGTKGYVADIGVMGNITGTNFVGGIAGRNYGTIENSYNIANITGNDYVGGITGYSDGLINNVYNNGNITANNRFAGGITGGIARNKELHNAYNTGNIQSLGSANTWTETGGIAGYSAGIITNTYSTGQVSARNSYIGGIVGRINGVVTIEDSYFVLESNQYFVTTNKKAVNAIGNSTLDGAKAIYKNQITSDQTFGVNLNKSLFILKQSDELQAYFPQLAVFQKSGNALIKEHSTMSVTNSLLYGEGLEDNPYIISSSFDLRALGIVIKQGFETLNIYYKVADNAVIDFELLKDYYVAIGDLDNPFSGNFNGNNIIMNVAIDNKSKDYQGVFGVTSSNSRIYNINATGYIVGNNYTGLLIGKNLGTLDNININDANITGNNFVGGLAGYSENTITNTGVKGIVNGNSYVGGLSGHVLDVNISISYFMGRINANDNYVGGLIAKVSGNTGLEEVFANGGIIAPNSNYVGGLFGEFTGEVNNAYATVGITGYSDVAGIAAINNGLINETYYSGEIKANARVAGVAVTNNGTLNYVYYNKTEILNTRNLKGLITPTSALYNAADNNKYGGRTLDNMTAYFSLGSELEQMNFDGSLYKLKTGADFTLYFPELTTYANHVNEMFKADSLKSVTYKKIDGAGSKNDPFLIYDGYDMMTIHNYVNSGNVFTNKYFAVASGVKEIDISLPELEYSPIGTNEFNFNGYFDGNNATFKIDLKEDAPYQGMFHTIGTNATIANLTIVGAIKGTGYIGSVAGRNLGKIINVVNYASVTSNSNVDGGNDIGGIVGYNDGIITNVTNNGVVSSYSSYTGGIAGQSTNEINEAYNRAPVSGFGNVGGIVGMNAGKITNAYNSNTITAFESVAGGIAGTTFANILFSYNSGNVTADLSVAGGIVGVLNGARVEGVYNSGIITAKNTQAAGIAAYFNGGNIIDSYQFGSVFAEDDLGTIVAFLVSGTITRSYYDKDRLALDSSANYKKPNRAVGNKEVSTPVGLYHGQMLGLHAISKNNINISSANKYLMAPSFGDHSYYPQIAFFANSKNPQVKEDSIKSVETLTFIVGLGTKVNPYLIRNESDWLALADSTTGGNDYLGKHFVVSEDIYELNFADSEDNYKLMPVGTIDKPFNGTLDGKGINFRIHNSNNNSYQALFGEIGEFGTVKNISLSGYLKGGSYTAGIAAINKGLIESVYNQATIVGTTYTAGIVSLNTGVINNVYNRGKITGTNYVAGITAYLDGDLNNSYNTGIIYGRSNTGTIVGLYEKGLFTNSYYDKTILASYRDVGLDKKPQGAVGSSFNGDKITGLDKRFMIGQTAIGTGSLNMNFSNPSNVWSTSYNTSNSNHYPQLEVFARDTLTEVKALSRISTLTELYTITFDERNEEEAKVIVKDVTLNEHYNLYVPEYFGYNFLGWYYLDGILEVQVTNNKGDSLKTFAYEENIEVFARWEEAYHVIDFVDGNNKVIASKEIRHGQYLEKPEALIPEKKKDALYVYSFLRWDFDFDNTQILKPLRITAQYDKIDRYYDIIYLDGNGDFFDKVRGEYETYLAPQTKIPTKTYHDNVAYKFVEWDFNYNEVIKKSETISPSFIAVDRYYNVNFFNDGVFMETKVAEYLFGVDAPEGLPVMSSTEKYDYKFVGWDQDISKVTDNIDVNAVYTESLRKYTVIFMNGNNTIFNTQEVEYGSAAAIPLAKPTKDYHDNIAYKFDGWIEDFNVVKGNLTVYPSFSEVDRYYTVKFFDALGINISTQTVEYLSDAMAPNDEITKTMTEKYEYIFTGWNLSFVEVESNLDIYPNFDEVLRSFNVYFMIDDNDIYDMQVVLYGGSAKLPEGKPFKDGTDDIGYKFVSWNVNYKNITTDTYVNANYTEVKGRYIVTFLDGDMILKTETVNYGHSATAPVLNLDNHPTEGSEYYFVKWSRDFEFVDSDFDVKLTKAARLKRFVVTIINGDITTTQEVEWNKHALLPVPFKAATEQVSYVFANWDDLGKNIKEDRTITAVFNEDYSYFEVRFYDGDNKIIKIEKVTPEGNAIAPDIAYKTKTDLLVYIFNGWDIDFTEVMENLNVYAKFEAKDRYYTVIFNDAYGNLLTTDTVEYGLEAIAPLAPDKVLEERYNYVFTGWDKEFDFVTSNLVISPLYDEIIKTYVVEFYDGDNNLIKSVVVDYGLNAIAPTSATKTPTDNDYYVFSGWDNSFSNVKQDLKINAMFDRVDRWYNVSFVDDLGIVLDSQTIEYGSDATDPRPWLAFIVIDEDFVYVITGWIGDYINVTKDLVIEAVYGTVARYYEVTFYNDDGTILYQNLKVEYGSSLIAPADPVKIGDSDYFYIFSGWDNDYSFVTSNLEIYATYEKLKTKYEVTFIDGNGNVFDHQVVDYGLAAVDPGIPPKAPTEELSFIFTGWDLAFDKVTDDLIITAVYSDHARTFTVIFMDENGYILKEEQVRRGSNATPPENIKEKPSTNYFEYILRWENSYINITEDTIITLYYDQVDRMYQATFYNYDGTTIYQVVTGTYGQFISAPVGPDKPMTDKFIYEFISWDPSFDEFIYENREYYAVYNDVIRHFNVVFIDGNGDVYEEQLVAYGQTPEKPFGIPIKDESQQYYHIFRMWETTTIKVYQDLEIRALFYNNLQQYEVTFVDEFGNTIEKQMVEYGTGAIAPDSHKIPTKPSTPSYEYAFGGWEPQFSYITENITVSTYYIGTLRKFTYTFVMDDEVVIIKQIVGSYGDRIVQPEMPTKDGTEEFTYEFLGWNEPVAEILTKNETYIARFKVVPKTFTVIFLDGNDNVFNSQVVIYGEAAIDPLGVPSKDPTIMWQYEFIGWDTNYDAIKDDLVIRATFKQRPREYEVKFIVKNEVIKTVYVNYGDSAYNLISTPQIQGYRFIDWDKNLTRIVGDIQTHAIIETSSYDIIFKDGFEDGDLIVVEGVMKPIIVHFDDKLLLPKVQFTREGYIFLGWRREDENFPSYADQHQFTLEEEGLTLVAVWLPELYDINYDLDGGFAINPESYTVEDYIILQSALKLEHKFLGWYITNPLSKSIMFMNTTFEETKVEFIDFGTIGNITLTARYKYDGFIKLKDESTLGMFYADIVSTIPIEERESYDDENPVYLLGVFLGQTLENLRNNFENDNLIFTDSKEAILTDDKVVATGYQIILKDDEGMILDRVHIVLKGDTDGDGRITGVDINFASNYINKSNKIIGARVLAMDIDGDGRVTGVDINLISNHINKSKPIWTKDFDSTMTGAY